MDPKLLRRLSGPVGTHSLFKLHHRLGPHLLQPGHCLDLPAPYPTSLLSHPPHHLKEVLPVRGVCPPIPCSGEGCYLDIPAHFSVNNLLPLRKAAQWTCQTHAAAVKEALGSSLVMEAARNHRQSEVQIHQEHPQLPAAAPLPPLSTSQA